MRDFMNSRTRPPQITVGQSQRHAIWLPCVAWLLCGVVTTIFGTGSLVAETASAEVMTDWPTLQQNNQRNAVVPAQIDITHFRQAWLHQDASPPTPAWYGPAKWDAYAGIKDLKSMRDYDTVNHVIAVGDAIYVGSSTEECVRCLDVASGAERWCFFTDGPVRVAPTYHRELLYFGSDDGHAYCVNAVDGQLRWKFRPVEPERLIVGDGRLLPFHPVRTGVMIQDGRAYFGASLLPWETSYLCAVNADTGKADGDGCFIQQFPQQTLEGAMASTDKLLIAPQGRVAPDVFARTNGSKLGSLPGGGGSFVVITGNEVFHGPGNKTGWITSSNADNQTQIASYRNANAIVAYDNRIVMLTDDSLVATDHQRQPLWDVACDTPLALIGVGNVLITGGTGKVVAYALADGQQLWQATVHGKVQGLAFARGRLFASTDTGAVIAFAADDAAQSAGTSSSDLSPTNAALTPTVNNDLPLADPPKVDEAGLIGRWVFQEPHVHVHDALDLQKRQNGRLAERARLVRVGKRQALRMDGQTQSITLTEDHRTASLPTDSLTAEAWVRLDHANEWGGLIGAVLDNGPNERGWLLGTHKKKFTFAIQANGGPAKLTYLSAAKSFDLGEWYHVVGTYDGALMQLFVNGELVGESTEQKGAIRYPEQTFYEIGAYHDSDERYPIQGLLHEVRLYGRALSRAEVASHYQAARMWFPESATVANDVSPTTHRLALGPWLQFTSPSTAVVRWHTHQPCASHLEYRLGSQVFTARTDGELKTVHQAELSQLQRNRVYLFNIHEFVNGQPQSTGDYECDTFFNYQQPSFPGLSAANAGSSPISQTDQTPQRTSDQQRANAIALELCQLTQRTSSLAPHATEPAALSNPGLCLVIGDDTEALLQELAANSQMRVIGLFRDPLQMQTVRQRLHVAGLYGPRVIVRHADTRTLARITPRSADLVVLSAGSLNGLDAAALRQRWQMAERLVAPCGIAATVDPNLSPNASGQDADTSNHQLRCQLLAATREEAPTQRPTNVTVATAGDEGLAVVSLSSAWELSESSTLWLARRGNPFDGAGDWSHVYGAADNSAYGGEALSRAKTSDDLAVQWIGRPGPRYQADRNGRKPPPLSTNGRLFLQGLHRIVALNIYNGTILWSLELPHLDRYNMPRDSGNWCADEDYLYVVIGDACWQIDAASGHLVRLHAVAPLSQELAAQQPSQPSPDVPMHEWGYVARAGDLLVGSTAKSGSSWTNFWGNEAWYDGTSGEVTHKVCSNQLFAVDPATGENAWTYQQGVVVNSSITIGNGIVYFVETQNPEALSATSGRLGDDVLWKDQYLVAIDARTGEQLWRSPLNTEPGKVAYYMAYGNDKLVIVASADIKYHVYAFDARVGSQEWQTSLAWGKGKADHGSHLSRPAIVGNKLFVRPAMIELSSGEISELKIPVGGCGTYACTDAALFFRAGSGNNFAMWDANDGTYSQWSRLRPDCWLSTIPSGGMLLSPEGGGGCSCGKWMETSLGFIPRKLLTESAAGPQATENR